MGGGSTPTLTNDFVLFTDNLDPVNLLALSVKTGDIVAQTPILDQLPTNTQVTVENSILVYSADPSRTSVVVCNWFGAGNAELTEPGSDSSIQTYENIYDPHWIQQGNVMLDPGVERVDFIRQGDRYTAQTLWTREDIQDTSMIKLATGTGYLYGYWQNLDTSMWSYYALDFDTGETVLEVPVSSEPAYNNMAVGMIVDVTGNALYCPTNKQQLLRLQDRFVYLPDARMQRIDLDKTKRYVLEETALRQGSGMAVTPASYLCSAVISPQDPETLVAFRVNGLSQIPSALTLFLQTPGQQYVPMEAAQWQLTDA